jgi:hypothetical protein
LWIPAIGENSFRDLQNDKEETRPRHHGTLDGIGSVQSLCVQSLCDDTCVLSALGRVEGRGVVTIFNKIHPSIEKRVAGRCNWGVTAAGMKSATVLSREWTHRIAGHIGSCRGEASDGLAAAVLAVIDSGRNWEEDYGAAGRRRQGKGFDFRV